MLIYLESYNNPRTNNDTDNDIFSFSYFNHHYFSAIECIYRAWERISRAIYFIHTNQTRKEKYYNLTIEILTKSKKYPDSLIKELELHKSAWRKLKTHRNEFSHEDTNLMHGINFEVEPSSIVTTSGSRYLKILESRPDLKEKFSFVYKQYLYLKCLDSSLIEFFKFVNGVTR